MINTGNACRDPASCFRKQSKITVMTNFDESRVRKSGDVTTSYSSGAASSNPVEGSSPDLLKNTPSNIATLEDAIEQFKSRQNYLAHTKSPSDGEDVRWYLCKVPLAEKRELTKMEQLHS